MADEKRYSLAQLMFDDLEIVAGGFKVTFKMEEDELTATNSHNSYDSQDGKETIEWEASDIDPAQRKDLQRICDKKIRGTVATYDFDEDNGNLIEDDVLYKAKINELSKENSNKPFSIKGSARYKKKVE